MSPTLLGHHMGMEMKKPQKSVSDYYNYKGSFSMVLLALVDAEYRFLGVDCGSSGSSSDAQIFNWSDLREKIEDGTLKIPPPEPLGAEEPETKSKGCQIHCFDLCGVAQHAEDTA